jgi:hypothetical protein
MTRLAIAIVVAATTIIAARADDTVPERRSTIECVGVWTGDTCIGSSREVDRDTPRTGRTIIIPNDEK